MPFGAGKYDDVATEARLKTQARGVMLMVFDGTHGGGFSAQLPPDLLLTMPAILREVAKQIEESWKAGRPA